MSSSPPPTPLPSRAFYFSLSDHTPQWPGQQSERASSTLCGTLSDSANKKKRTSDNALRRVERVTASLNQRKCLIENTDIDESDVKVGYVHLLPQTTKHNILSKLEYHWNMRYGTLNINTRRNIVILGTKFHSLMDKGYWFLLPEKHILDDYFFNHGVRSDFPQLNDTSYKYTIIARGEMMDVPIDRHEPPSTAALPAPDHFTRHVYPYTSLGTLSSHVHPQFAICRAGQLMKDGAVAFAPDDDEMFLLLDRVLIIYEMWTTPVKDRKEWRKFTETKPPDLEADNQSTSTHTGAARSTCSMRCGTKRKHEGSQGDSPSRKKLKGGRISDGVWLDSKTLRKLDKKRSPRKAWADKVAFIASWVVGVQKDVDVTNGPLE